MYSWENFKEAADFLRNQDGDLAKIIELEGACRLTVEKKTPYLALLKAIAGQQLHNKATQAILNRLRQLGNGSFPEPERLLSYDRDQLRGCGFSFRKIEALYGLASATLAGKVPTYEQALDIGDSELMDCLIQLPGVGKWTVEMFLIFTLGRMDVMPVDDFGVREGWRLCKGLSQQPKPRILKEATSGWSPYRSVGAWYLWRAVERLKPETRQNPLTK